MANIKLTSHFWETEGIYDISQGKTQKQINTDVSSAINILDSTMSMLPNPNLLSNWYFGSSVVNTKGKESYDYSDGTSATGIDGWIFARNKLNVTGECIEYERVVSNYNPTFSQRFSPYPTDTYTLSILYKTSISGNKDIYAIGVNIGEITEDTSRNIRLPRSNDWNCASFTFTNKCSGVYFQDLGAFDGVGVVGDKLYIKAIKLEQGSAQTLAHQENGSWILNEIPNNAEECAKVVENSGSSHHAVPSRAWAHIKSQEEFEAYLEKFNTEGEVSYNCYFDAAGTYKVKLPDDENRVVFSTIQAHWFASVDGVVVDLNGCIFYTSHLQFTGVTKSLGTMPTYTFINSNSSYEPYFEGCNVLFNYVTFRHLLRLWSDFTTISNCWFTNDLLNPSSYTSCIDVIQGVCHLNNNYFDVDYSTLPSSVSLFAIFGIGNSPQLKMFGRTAIRDCDSSSTNIYLFRPRQWQGLFEIFTASSYYNIGQTGGYNSSARRGHFRPSSSADLSVLMYAKTEAAINQFFYMFASGTTMYGKLIPMEELTFS